MTGVIALLTFGSAGGPGQSIDDRQDAQALECASAVPRSGKIPKVRGVAKQAING
jgi:hypothetical protein